MAAIENMRIATGLKEALVNAGISFEKILNSPPSEISDILGIDSYVAKLIYDEARKTATNEENLSNPAQFNQFLSQMHKIEAAWLVQLGHGPNAQKIGDQRIKISILTRNKCAKD